MKVEGKNGANFSLPNAMQHNIMQQYILTRSSGQLKSVQLRKIKNKETEIWEEESMSHGVAQQGLVKRITAHLK